MRARTRIELSGDQNLGGDGSGGGDKPCRAASLAGQTTLSLGGLDRITVATPIAGATPTQATTQPAAVGGHGMPSHDGQCCEHKAPTVV
jgi:hypothetical protein